MGITNPICKVIVVDEDAQSLNQISELLGRQFKVMTSRDPRIALNWLETDLSVGIIIVEQVLRSGFGINLLQTAKNLRPEVRRVLITRYCDMGAIVQGLHSGVVNQTISKPILHSELLRAVANPSSRMSA
jgi:DNA-binding NtrC family response regulator